MKKSSLNFETLLAIATPLSLLIVAMSIYQLSDRIDRLTSTALPQHPISIEIASDKHVAHNISKKPATEINVPGDNHSTNSTALASDHAMMQTPQQSPSIPSTKPASKDSNMVNNMAASTTQETNQVVEPTGVVHTVEALNNGPDGAMVFSPGFIKIAAGDSITFKPTSYGHNAQTPELVIGDEYKPIPLGAQPFASAMNEEITVTFTVPGIYLYLCNYHYVVGHVGIIQVGNDSHNLDAVRAAGKALQAKMFSNASRIDDYLAAIA